MLPKRIQILASSCCAALFLLGLALAGCVSAPQAAKPTVAASATTAAEVTAASTPTLPQPTSTPLPPTPTTLPSTPTVTPAPACAEAHGEVQASHIEPSPGEDPITFNIYLPPCYSRDLDRRYPVLYLIHGQTYTADQWDRLGADDAADWLIASGEAPPFLIVFPYDPDWRQPTEDPFGEMLAGALVPWVDAHYRTLPDRDHRAIGGLSRGAGWAVHLGLTRWDLFSAAGAHSLALFWTDPAQVPGWLDAIPSGSKPRFYLDIGRSDPELRNAKEFEALLNAHDVPHEWHLFDGYHDEEYWAGHVEGYIRWYAEGWGE